MDAQAGRGPLFFLAGIWVVYECATSLIDFIDTGMMRWPQIFKTGASDPALVSYANDPVATVVGIALAVFGGLMGVCAVGFGVGDFWKILNSPPE